MLSQALAVRLVMLTVSFFGLTYHHFVNFLLGPAHYLADRFFFSDFILELLFWVALSSGLSFCTYALITLSSDLILAAIFRILKLAFGKLRGASVFRKGLKNRNLVVFILNATIFVLSFSLMATGSVYFAIFSVLMLFFCVVIGGIMHIFSHSRGRVKLKDQAGLILWSANDHLRALGYSVVLFAFSFSFILANGMAEGRFYGRTSTVLGVSNFDGVILGRTQLGVIVMLESNRAKLRYISFDQIDAIEWTSTLYFQRGFRKLLN